MCAEQISGLIGLKVETTKSVGRRNQNGGRPTYSTSQINLSRFCDLPDQSPGKSVHAEPKSGRHKLLAARVTPPGHRAHYRPTLHGRRDCSVATLTAQSAGLDTPLIMVFAMASALAPAVAPVAARRATPGKTVFGAVMPAGKPAFARRRASDAGGLKLPSSRRGGHSMVRAAASEVRADPFLRPARLPSRDRPNFRGLGLGLGLVTWRIILSRNHSAPSAWITSLAELSAPPTPQ